MNFRHGKSSLGKTLWVGAIALSLLAAGTVTGRADATDSKNDELTIAQYKMYLQNYSEEDAQKAGVSQNDIYSAVVGAKDQLTSFNKLSVVQQQQFVDKMNHPDLNNLQAQKDDSLISGLSVSLASTHTRTASMNYSWKPASWMPSVLAFHDSVTYKVKGKKVERTISDDNYVKYNYNPLVSITKNGDKRHVSKNLAYTWARWQYTLGYNGNGAHLGNCNLSIWGNVSGDVVNYHAFKS